MLDNLLELFDGSSLSVWGPFGVLILCGVGLPIPEDLILIAAGMLGADRGQPVWHLIALMYAGILIGDLITYGIGRRFGRKFLGTRVGRYMLNEERLSKSEEYFKKYGTRVVFVGRFLPGLRAPIFFSAGVLRFPIARFLMMDGFAALVSAPAFVWLGHWAWSALDVESLEKNLAQGKRVFAGLIAAIGLSVCLYLWIRKRTRAKKKA